MPRHATAFGCNNAGPAKPALNPIGRKVRTICKQFLDVENI